MEDTEVYSAYPGSLRLQPKESGALHSLPQAFQRHNPGNYIKERNAKVLTDILEFSRVSFFFGKPFSKMPTANFLSISKGSSEIRKEKAEMAIDVYRFTGCSFACTFTATSESLNFDLTTSRI